MAGIMGATDSIRKRWIAAMAGVLALLFLASAFIAAFLLSSHAGFTSCAASGCSPALVVGLALLAWLLTLPLAATALLFGVNALDVLLRQTRARGAIEIADDGADTRTPASLSQIVKRLTADLATERQARIEADARADYALSHDALTGLVNRTRMAQLIAEAVARTNAPRPGGEEPDGFALFFLDFDDFKYLNDTHGHIAGDQFLRLMGDRLRRMLDCDDCVARIGGDEFLVLSEQVASAADAASIAELLLKEIARPCLINGVDVRVTTSIGVALCPQHASDAQQLINRADRAMYAAKERGRNTFQIASAL
jgi:diguanylate cyclase (GGDEF)-like protein